MSEFKNITISIPVDAYERVEKLCSDKRKGMNRVRDFYTNIFIQGLESPEFLKAENRRLATKLRLAEILLKKHNAALPSSAMESIARNAERCEDLRDAAPAKRAPETPAVPDAHPAEADDNSVIQ